MKISISAGTELYCGENESRVLTITAEKTPLKPVYLAFVTPLGKQATTKEALSFSGTTAEYLLTKDILDSSGELKVQTVETDGVYVKYSKVYRFIIDEVLNTEASEEINGELITLQELYHMLQDVTQSEVQSVNGKTGFVQLSAEDVGASPHFTTDKTLTLKDGVLSVNTANTADKDNTLPITSAAVAVTVGNIEAILQTI